MKKTLTFLLFLTAIFARKLTPEEDEQRAKTCGRVVEPLLNTPQFLAPWVAYFVDNTYFHDAFLISPYHLIMASRAIMNSKMEGKIMAEMRPNHYKWVYNNRQNERVNVDECRNGVLKLANHRLSSVGARFFCVKCGHLGHFPVKSVTYIGNCELGKAPIGLAIIELEKPAMEDKQLDERGPDGNWKYKMNQTITPVCLPGTSITVDIGDSIEEHTIDRKMYSTEVIIDKGNQTIAKCPNSEGGRLMCMNQATLFHISGYVKNFYGADILVGLNFNVKTTGPMIGVSTSYFKDKICELTGVCMETIVEKPEVVEEEPRENFSDACEKWNVELLIASIILIYLSP
ncbi:hypothetical protein CAEBREN_07740 [Caenorhabditis brenneri]|uniref:Uncharacterized protein n=1 Tax=Caenorhabditis brenneri TaxID=135651 RepID=G0MD76_CAEBE|nr:hypothetical protein CAEBREN_07740 [Caenorhabditis brenneri]